MKLVWLDVNASHAHSSLALPLLHNAARSMDAVSWAVVRATPHADVASLTEEVVQLQPDVVALSLYLFSRRYVLSVCARVCALLPRCQFIFGGPECLGSNVSLLERHPFVAAAVRGEGEAVFPVLLEHFLSGSTPSGLPGVCFRDTGGEIRDCGTRAIAPQWADAPFPCTSRFFAADKPFVQLETSRGCHRSCAFCSSCAQRPVRLKPLERVRHELRLLSQRDVREVRVLDRTFNLHADRAGELLDLFVNSFPNITFHIEVHPEMLTDALRQRLAAVPPGRLHVEAGLQTTASAALKATGRGGDPVRALDGIGFLTSRRGFKTHVDLLAGLPEQTLDDVFNDVRSLMDLGPAEIQLETVKALPGTPFREDASERGIVFSPDPPYDVMKTNHLSVSDIRCAAHLSRFIDMFYNQPALQIALRRICRQAPGAINAILREAIAQHLVQQPASLKRRLRFLYEWVAEKSPDHLDDIRSAWIKAGLSPADSIPAARPWKQPLPERLIWTIGSRRDADSETARIWTMHTHGSEHWVVYDRRRSQHKPVAWAQTTHPNRNS